MQYSSNDTFLILFVCFNQGLTSLSEGDKTKSNSNQSLKGDLEKSKETNFLKLSHSNVIDILEHSDHISETCKIN